MANGNYVLASVADVVFLDAISDAYLGEGLALTESTITQETQAMEVRGGFLNGLIANIKHSKNVNMTAKSATFKMEYLAWQEGQQITTGLSDVLRFTDCVKFTNGVGTASETPVGNVWITKANGTVITVSPNGKTINTGDATLNGSLNCKYFYQGKSDQIVIDTKKQPLTIKAVVNVKVFSQEEEVGVLQITIPLLKLDGNVSFDLTADGAATFGLNGSALQYNSECGKSYYADVKLILNNETDAGIVGLAAIPNEYTLSLAEGNTATANIVGIRNASYANINLNNSEVTWATGDATKATVTDGVIKAVAVTGATPVVITATYAGYDEQILVTVTE